MAALSDPVKLAIVRALACFDGPSEAAEVVKKEFGIAITRQQAALYDPTKPAGKSLSPKLAAIFHATREAFLKDVAAVPIANQAFRLRRIQRLLDKAELRGNDAMVLKLLEQAAREVGGMFTNRRELTGRGSAASAAAMPQPLRLVPSGLTNLYASNNQLVASEVRAVLDREASAHR